MTKSHTAGKSSILVYESATPSFEMAFQTDNALDEIQWASPALAQSMGGIHTNTVLHYFQASPFFDDPTSNNAILVSQAATNASMAHFVATREAFEGYLSGTAGTEFRVVHDPSNGDRIQTHEHSGVWVIRKQRRVKSRVHGQPDQITPLNTYFVVGINIYMAPKLGGILNSRIVSPIPP